MNKSQFWQVVWIPITKRLPDKDAEKVLVWNAELKFWRELEGYTAYEHAKKLLAGDMAAFVADRHFSHWCLPQPPGRKR